MGDLAVIVGGFVPEILGRIIEVMSPCPGFPEPSWNTKPELFLPGITKPIAIADDTLMPIRDPGDDAVDWISQRTPRSIDLREDAAQRTREQLQEAAS